MRQELRTSLAILAVIILVVVIGTVGYMLIEGWNFLDSLYMTVTTIFTVGFGEVHPLSRGGHVFTLVVIVLGVGTLLYGLGAMVEFVITGQLSGMFRRRVVKKRVERLEGHYIICGYGRVGEAVAEQFRSDRAKFVVVDNDPDSIERAEAAGILVVRGDASTDEVLEAAGVTKAKGLVSAVGSDAGNIFIVLSARVMNPELFIIARSASTDAISKLRRAGASRVVSPYDIGGRKMATLMLKPLVSDYLEVVTGGGELAFLVEEFQLAHNCCVIGQSIEALDVRKKTGSTILAVQRASTGLFDTNPSPDATLLPGDKVIAIGTSAEISKLESLIMATPVVENEA
jgi:voltage-gated potassium channel